MAYFSMKKWLDGCLSRENKKTLPLLSFPSAGLLGVSVGRIVTDADLQAAGMRAVRDRTDAAASVSFMDLSVEAECFGATVVLSEDEVPTVKEPILADTDGVANLAVPAVGGGRTGVYLDAVRKAAETITDRPVLAGMIGPFSLSARLMDMSEIMMACYDDPDGVHALLRKTTDFLLAYARAYRAAGANGIVLAEPVAGLLSPILEAEFSSPYVKEIADAVQDDDFLLIYHNCGGNVPRMLDSIFSTGCGAYHFGNAVDLAADILPHAPSGVPILGNVDPAGVLKKGTPAEVREATLALLRECASYPTFILSSGCDIPPTTPWENLAAFFGAAKEFYEGLV